MLSRIAFLLLFCTGFLNMEMSMAQAQQTHQSEQRIVFLGDSITQQGNRPGGYVALVREAIEQQADQSNIKVIGAGISGNKVPNLLKRLDKDVLAKVPTHVVIYIGINDVWHSLKNNGTPKDVFESGLKKLISKIEAAGAKVLLCTPSVVGEKTDGSNELDAMLDEYAQITRDVASETNTALLDLHLAFDTELNLKNPGNKPSGILTRDGVHLNSAGNRFVADRMLDALAKFRLIQVVNAKLRHIVMFQFKPETSDEQVAKIMAAFAKLPEQIDTIVEFEMGTNESPEKLDQGFTHCFVVTFADAAGRDVYLPHPAHQEFVKLLDGKIEKVLVFDYVTE